jgi:hypothetical protein
MSKKSLWTAREILTLRKLNSPAKIQQYLNDTPYNPVIECKSPRYVMKKRTAHCFEGALFAAAALQFNGSKPLVVDLVAEDDDDHVIAVFRYKNHWGAVAKSNCTTLRFREPVYRNIRELVMSYFDVYCNVKGAKSLRSYTRPINVNWLHSPDWIVSDEDLEPLGFKLFDYRHFPILSGVQIKNLSPVDKLLLKATLLGSNPKGLFIPGAKKDH